MEMKETMSDTPHHKSMDWDVKYSTLRNRLKLFLAILSQHQS